jgi:hypothetical protein
MNKDPMLKNLLERYEQASNNLDNSVEDKKLIVFDDLIERNHLDLLNSFCLNSKFTCDHASNRLNFEIDSRFVSGLTRFDFLNTELGDVCKKVGDRVGMKLILGNYYINHYSLMTPVSRHTDSSFPNTYTILVNCNKFWDEDWGGYLMYENDNEQIECIKPKKNLGVLQQNNVKHCVSTINIGSEMRISLQIFLEKEKPKPRLI